MNCEAALKKNFIKMKKKKKSTLNRLIFRLGRDDICAIDRGHRGHGRQSPVRLPAATSEEESRGSRGRTSTGYKDTARIHTASMAEAPFSYSKFMYLSVSKYINGKIT